MADLGHADRYAETLVGSCLHVREGDLVVVTAAPAQRELVIAVTGAAHRAGARLVEVVWADPWVEAARMRWAREEDLGAVAPWGVHFDREFFAEATVSLALKGESGAAAFAGLPPERVEADRRGLAHARRRIHRAALAGTRRWTVASWPTPDWAGRVYPELTRDEGVRRLREDLISFCRLDDGDGGWDAHAARVTERGRALTEARLTGLELRGPGTRLDLAIVPGTRWLGGPRLTAFGYPTTPNFPTEENHTTPHAGAVEGTFRCSRPLVFRGRLIEGIAGEFRRGKLIRLEAAREDDRDALAAALDVDGGARRLGEVALVDRSSRIGRTGRVYFETLLDENAAAHIAFGAAYTQTRTPESGTRGLNRSLIHLDVMIGTDDFEATGIDERGRRIPLLRDGTWQLP